MRKILFPALIVTLFAMLAFQTWQYVRIANARDHIHEKYQILKAISSVNCVRKERVKAAVETLEYEIFSIGEAKAPQSETFSDGGDQLSIVLKTAPFLAPRVFYKFEFDTDGCWVT